MPWILQDVPIGRNIQSIRMAKGMTQMAVVEQLELKGSLMSRSTLANIECGKRNIKASDLRLLKMLFNVESVFYSRYYTDGDENDPFNRKANVEHNGKNLTFNDKGKCISSEN